MHPTCQPCLRFSKQDPSATLLLTLRENIILPGYEEVVLLISALYTRHAIMISKMSRNADYCLITCQTIGS